MAKIKKIKKAQSGMLKPASRPVINDTSKTKGIGLEGFDPYKEKNSKEGRGGGGIKMEEKRPLIDVWRAARSKKKGGVVKKKKAQNGYTKDYPIPSVSKSPEGTKKGYKAKVVEKVTPEGRTATLKVRRTIGGFLSGKKKGGDYQIPAYNVPQRRNPEDSPERPKGSNMGNQDIPRRTKNGGKVTKKSISKPINKKSKKK
jgi:hypothetical protein